MYMYRTRFKGDILAEFLPPARRPKRARAVILCDGMPSIPTKQGLAEFLARKGFWVFYPRYRGSWESGGKFLKKSPHLDIRDVIDELPKGWKEAAFGRRFHPEIAEVYVIGGSFGGAAAALSVLDPRVKKAVAVCPVVDWAIQHRTERKETRHKNYATYLRQAFGEAYRLDPRDWAKLRKGDFYNPAFHASEIDPTKLLMFHAQDDPYIPWRSVAAFAKRTGAELRLLKRGGHLSTHRIVRKYWGRISRFFA